MRWEVKRLATTTAAKELNSHLYWTAPSSEGDTAGQIPLIDKVVQGGYQRLVVAPNHALALSVPLRRALAAGIPVVVVSTPLALAASNRLNCVVNDDEKMVAPHPLSSV